MDDIYIELIIKEDEYDKKYNKLEQYISFQNDDKNQKIIFINNKNEKIKTKIKKLKMVDCPLFAITKRYF